jgi:hypothetical protein
LQILFVDESNPAPKIISSGSVRYFVLAGIAVPELNWHSLAKALDNIKKRYKIEGEVKWRFFAANNNNKKNPLRHLSKEDRDRAREEMFAALRTRHHVRCMAVVASVQDAFNQPYVKDDDDLYFYCLKILTERFQYRIQDVNKEYGITRHGIVVLDGRDPGKDMKIREMHHRIVTGNKEFASKYANFCEGLFIAASHLSPGTQFADLIAGATLHYFSTGNRRWLDAALPAFRRSRDGRLEGHGLMFFPGPKWTENERRGVT